MMKSLKRTEIIEHACIALVLLLVLLALFERISLFVFIIFSAPIILYLFSEKPKEENNKPNIEPNQFVTLTFEKRVEHFLNSPKPQDLDHSRDFEIEEYIKKYTRDGGAPLDEETKTFLSLAIIENKNMYTMSSATKHTYLYEQAEILKQILSESYS